MGHQHERGASITFAIARPHNPHLDRLNALCASPELALYLQAEREKLLTVLRTAPSGPDVVDAEEFEALGLRMCHAFSDLTDAFLTRLLALSCANVGVDALAPPLALIATGGYGRRELCPFSDIDLTFVPLRDGDPRADRLIRDMFTQIMDICIGKCGLKVGYGYRLLEDCDALEHQTASGLLDARLVAGNERLFIRFEDAFWMGLNPTEFIFDKLAERRQTLEKWGTLPRVVEPHLKEGPGGLRDLQTALWLAQAREHLVAARVRGARSFAALERDSYLTGADARQFAAAKERLLQTRNILHAISGAARDLLVRTRQEEVAARLGYERPAPQAAGEAPPVERLMADLYPHLAVIRRCAAHIMQHVENSRLMLGIGLDCRRRKITPANGALETDDPIWLLWACELAQKHGLTFHERLEQSCAELLAIQPELPDPLAAAQVFTRILNKTGNVYPILQTMADLGILGWFVPEFGRIMDLIPYDPSHEFTVGQHTLRILYFLDQLAEEGTGKTEDGRRKTEDGRQQTENKASSFLLPPSSFSDEWLPDMRRILGELGHPEQLMLAALLHDCGKSLPGGAHADVGAELAERVCQRLQWSAGATANVVFLIRQHLLMAETSRLRDLNLDETIQDFTRIVDDPDRLDMLYLLTYADTRAVGEGVWSQVNGRFLHELWQRSSAMLHGEAAAPQNEERLARARRRMVKDLKLENLPDEEVTEHVQAMPPHYLLNQSLEHIALHIGLVRRVRQGEVVVDFYDARSATYTELTVCTMDDPQPGLLAKITAVLYAADLTVHSAQVFTRASEQDRIALDTLWVDFRGRQLSAGKQQEVAGWLQGVLRGEMSVQEVLSRRRVAGNPKASVPRTTAARGAQSGGSGPEGNAGARKVNTAQALTARNDLSSGLTLIEIEDPDVQGALYWTSQVLARLGWDIQSARVSLWRGAARASFYVAGARPPSESYSAEDIRQSLVHALCETAP